MKLYIFYRYTEGIKIKCNDPETNASLYNNRAACHWHLKNYRSSLYDSERAITFNPEHTKARLRAARSAFEISKYDICIQHCEKLKNDKEVVELINLAKKKKLIQERDERKEKRIVNKKDEERDAIIKMIVERGIRVSNCDDEDDLDLSKLEPCLPDSQDSMVHIENGILKWPVLLMYPEYQMTDVVKGCPENVSLLSQLEQLFPAPWDVNIKYSINTVNVYFEGYDKMPHVIDPKKDLGDLLVTKYFELKAGTPAFFILPRGSVIESRFLESYL